MDLAPCLKMKFQRIRSGILIQPEAEQIYDNRFGPSVAEGTRIKRPNVAK